MITLHTNYGDITLELNLEKAPVTSENFMRYVKEGFYNGTIFHRVIDGFMIQGGGFDEHMEEKITHDAIINEADNGLSNDTYTVAMARTMDPNSASSQFFINVSDNHFLNHSSKNTQGWGYCVFGKVTQGTDVVDKIKTVPTNQKGFHQDVPDELVIIESVTYE